LSKVDASLCLWASVVPVPVLLGICAYTNFSLDFSNSIAANTTSIELILVELRFVEVLVLHTRIGRFAVAGVWGQTSGIVTRLYDTLYAILSVSQLTSNSVRSWDVIVLID
jgi:hypothetical protein